MCFIYMMYDMIKGIMQRRTSVFECMLLQFTLWHCCFHLSEPLLTIKEAYDAFSFFCPFKRY